MNKRLKELRSKLGISQAVFAEKIGIKQTSYSDIETGRRELTERNLNLICKEFNVDENWLRNGEGSMFTLELDEDTMLIESLLNDVDNPIYELIKKFMKLYNSFGPTERAVLQKLALGLLEEQNNKKSENDN
jgi:HTH-type transcriptional regulator / antitoxin PezA